MNQRKFFIAAILMAIKGLSASAVSPVYSEEMPQGALSGRNIALWQSHGRYYDVNEDRWKWQRCRLFGTVEDLYTRSYVIPFLVPMLENAGAYVLLPRERDANETELIIDPDGEYAIDGYSEHNGHNRWTVADSPGFGLPCKTLLNGQNPFRMGHARQVKTTKSDSKKSTATWSATVPAAGEYAVYVSYPKMKNAVSDAHYVVHTAVGNRNFKVNQKMGAGTWIYLGTFPFAESSKSQTLVSLSNVSEQTGTVGADAVKIGGGMGNVARYLPDDETNAHISGMPRWTEAARYWLQWAGMPDSIYANQENDYRDDIFCRPQWVNYMRDSLNVPIDLVMAFHSDAGIEGGDTIVGTLGIYYTAKGGKYADGRSRRLGRLLCQSIVNSVVSDVRTLYEPEWTQRKLRDAKYIEARVPEVPTMLLELLSHQNFADMRYGLDPQFKFDVCRAVYKGILHYLADRGLAKYIVTPLAPTNLALTEVYPGKYRLTWTAQPDALESTAMPTEYVIERRIGSDLSVPFQEIKTLVGNEYLVDIPAGEIHSFRVIAKNKGGYSFPSEVMAAGWLLDSDGFVTVVNGFTRISAPDNFYAGNMAGFGLHDTGVPFGSDLSYTGKQYDFDLTSEWIHDDRPGFGASHADMETVPVYGNSFDYIVSHGAAIMAAGYSFDSSSVAAFTSSTSVPETVDLILGLQKETTIGRGVRQASHCTFSEDLQQRLTQLAAVGTGLMVSGAYIASDSEENITSTAGKNFLRTTLGIEWRTSHATTVGLVSEINSVFATEFGSGNVFKFNSDLGGKPYAVTSPDAISPVSSRGATIMRYDENQTSAAVAFEGETYRAVSFGFPFEALTSVNARNTLMKQTLNFLNNK